MFWGAWQPKKKSAEVPSGIATPGVRLEAYGISFKNINHKESKRSEVAELGQLPWETQIELCAVNPVMKNADTPWPS